mgnify:CR=1 FL=1
MNRDIAIIEDEPDILELVAVNLEKANYKVTKFNEGHSFLKSLQNKIPDLLILDLMLPDIDGIEICKKIKSDESLKNIAVIMLTAKSEEVDKVLGLEIGADDYVTKPFSPRELVARVKAVLRRSKDTVKDGKIIQINDLLKIDLDRYEVYVKGDKINLTSTEYRLLKLLAQKSGWVYSRNQLLDYLWGNDKIVLDRTIDVHIKNLREKLGPAKNLIKNIRGIGYKLEQ